MKLNKQKLFSVLTVLSISLSGVAQADLIDRGNGLIYDSAQDITWLQDANYAKTSGYAAANATDTRYTAHTNTTNTILPSGRMGWTAANTWVNQLVYEGFDDWRLPTLSPDGGLQNSELLYMHYVNLGNRGFLYTRPDRDGLPFNSGIFDNLKNRDFWSSVSTNPGSAEFYTTDLTNLVQQLPGDKQLDSMSAWAVRSGDVTASVPASPSPVPVPGALWLFGSGLIGLFGWKRRGSSC